MINFLRVLNFITSYFLRAKSLGLICLIFLCSLSISAQEAEECDEVLVRLFVKNLPQTDVAAIICENRVYISINELFGFTKVKYEFLDKNYQILEGFLSDPEDRYIIDATQNEIIYKDRRFQLTSDDVIVLGNNLYLALTKLDEAFNFSSKFIFRELAIVTSSAVELPAMKEARILERRLNINKILDQNYVGDSLIRRTKPWAEFGSLSYAINSNQAAGGSRFDRFQISAGGQIAGGDLETTLITDAKNPLTLRNFSANYAYVDNELSAFKQFEIGNVGASSISTTFLPLLGFKLTNRSTQLRKSFNFYTITDYTEPLWTVELYVNNILLDYTQADETGLYSFSVPIVYGRTTIDLRFFGRFGEEETEQRLVNVPYSFLPPGEFEYQITGGTFAGESGSLFSQVQGLYGATNFLTLGVGSEFLRFQNETNYFPFLSADLKISNNLLLSSEYAYETRFKSSLNYFTNSNFNVQLNITELSDKQSVIRQGAKRQINTTLALPVRYKFIQGFGRLRFDYRSNRDGIYSTRSQIIYSGRVFGLSSNLTTSVLKNVNAPATVRFRGITTFDIYGDFKVSPELLYDASSRSVEYARFRIRKKLYGRGLIDFNYTRSFFSNANQFSLGLRWDFDYARAGARIAITDDVVTFGQNISGGVLFNNYDDSVLISKDVSLGRSFLTFVPYLDYNDNNVRDFNEPNVVGLGGKLNKGRTGNQNDDGQLKFNSLQPYLDYYVELNTFNMESVAYKLDKESYNITLSPNKVTTVEVPIKITGEVAGYVYRNRNGATEPFSRIKVNILDEKFNTVATVLSEYDGYFSYLGLKNGNYTARLDNVQLQQVFYSTNKPIIEFTIDNSSGGDILDNLEFYLEPEQPNFDIFEKIIKNINY